MPAIPVDGAFVTTKALLPHMRESARGGIYLGSVHSKEASLLNSAYVPARHGPIGLGKVVARHGVRANEDVAEATLFCAGFPSNATTGPSFIVSHGWFMQ